METKSRYEVIAELEGKKRDLIKERDNLVEESKAKDKSLVNLERQKVDTIVILDRQIEDAKEEADRFKTTMTERKVTVEELIGSVNDSLDRFGKLGERK